MFDEGKEDRKVNPYLEKIFETWFKNIILLILLIPTSFFVIYGIIKGWVDKDFGLQMFFLLFGLYIGKWFENGKK